MDMEEHAKNIKRIREYINDGWDIWDVDMIAGMITLYKYNGKQIKKNRKMKAIKLHKAEYDFLNMLAEAEISNNKDAYIRSVYGIFKSIIGDENE